MLRPPCQDRSFPGPGVGRAASGITMLELMIAVAIVGVLLAVALPSFLGQLRQTRRADALDAAAALQHAQERWRAKNVAYAPDLTTLGMAATSANGYYSLALSNATTTGYKLTLKANAGTSQANDSGCTTLTVSVNKGVATPGPTGCWKK